MTDYNFEKEKDTIDFVTEAMLSLDFLEAVSNLIFSNRRNDISVGKFYDEWLKGTGANQKKVPCSLGAILGYLYCGILLPKENWFDLLPDIEIAQLDSSWSLKDISIDAPKTKNLTLRHLVRRIRNSLGHGNVIFHVPEKITDRKKQWTETTLEFNDVNPREPSDTFHVIISLDNLIKVVKKIQSIVHANVRERLK